MEIWQHEKRLWFGFRSDAGRFSGSFRSWHWVQIAEENSVRPISLRFTGSSLHIFSRHALHHFCPELFQFAHKIIVIFPRYGDHSNFTSQERGLTKTIGQSRCQRATGRNTGIAEKPKKNTKWKLVLQRNWSATSCTKKLLNCRKKPYQVVCLILQRMESEWHGTGDFLDCSVPHKTSNMKLEPDRNPPLEILDTYGMAGSLGEKCLDNDHCQ